MGGGRGGPAALEVVARLGHLELCGDEHRCLRAVLRLQRMVRSQHLRCRWYYVVRKGFATQYGFMPQTALACRQFATAVVPIGGGLSVQWRWLRSGSSASYTTGSGRRIPFGMSAMWSQSSHRWLSRVLLSWLPLLHRVCPICLISLILGLGPRAPFMSHPQLEPLTLLASYRMGTAPSQRRLQLETQAWRVAGGQCLWMGGLTMRTGRRWRRALQRRSPRQSLIGFRSMCVPLC